ncbi:hypothetical protein EBU71_00685 [bacterium]|nr:hypothetical protein [Candidatus Elulimicrobium humile]
MTSRFSYQSPITVRSISYGGRTIKGATDLNMAGADDGEVIVYDANTKSFKVAPISSAAQGLDAGEF